MNRVFCFYKLPDPKFRNRCHDVIPTDDLFKELNDFLTDVPNRDIGHIKWQ